MTERRSVCMNRRKFRNYVTSGGKRASVQPSKQLGLFLTDGTSFAPLTYARQSRVPRKEKEESRPRYRLATSRLLSLRDDSSKQRNHSSQKKRSTRSNLAQLYRWIFESCPVLPSKFKSGCFRIFFLDDFFFFLIGTKAQFNRVKWIISRWRLYITLC